MPNENGSTEKRDLTDVMIAIGGDRFQIPDGVTMQEARDYIDQKMEEDENLVEIHEVVRCFPLDGAVALARYLKKRFGWTNLVPQHHWWGTERPTLVGVDIDHGVTEQIPWGQFRVPKIDGTIKTSFVIDDDGLPVFVITGTVKRKHEEKVAEIASAVRKEVAEHSIYRGKAIKVNLRTPDGSRIDDYGPDFAPRFMELKTNTDEIVYSEQTGLDLQINLFNPIEKTQKCRKNNIPLKRGIMLAGPFGTGKTLTADMAAILCEKNGWTFIYLQDARDLDIALGFAELYAPCVLFAEDIDKAVPNGARDPQIDKMFNTMDGVDTKKREVMTVLTTNNLANCHPGFMRPGRIDTVVHVTTPDLGAAVRLVKQYGRDEDGKPLLVASSGDIEEAMKPVLGINAAFIREIVERAKLKALDGDGEELQIQGIDLETAVKSLVPHIKLLHPDLELPGETMDMEEIEIDPMREAMDFLASTFAYQVLTQLVNPKNLSELKVKAQRKRPKKRGFGGQGGSFSNN